MIDPKKPNLGGTPTAPWRPRFDPAPADSHAEPIVSVVTSVARAGPALLDTAESLLAQTFQAFEWIVVDDRIEDADERTILDLLLRRDPRIVVLSHTARRGRNAALATAAAASRSSLLQVLDAGDQLEATALEKCFWALESHPDWAFVGSWSVAFGDEYALRQGGFDTPAEGGRRGGTVPEVLLWCDTRVPRDASANASLRRVPAPAAGDAVAPRRRHREELPTLNRLVPRAKRLLAIVGAVASDGPGALWIDALSALSKRGWRVTFVCDEVLDDEAMPALARTTSDLHVLSRFLAPRDRPRFARYLVESRSPEWVLYGSDALGASIAPYLRARCAGPRYAELRVTEGPGDSASDSSLDAHAPVSLAPAVDPAVWKPRLPPREWLRPQWGATHDDLVLVWMTGRDDADLAARLVDGLGRLVHRGIPVRLVAAGVDAKRVVAIARDRGVADRVVSLGRQPLEGQIRVLSAGDVFVAPAEAVPSIATLRAMACELPIVELHGPIDACVDRVAALAIDPARRAALGRAARATVLGSYGIADVVQQLLATLTAPRAEIREPDPRVRAFETAVTRLEATTARTAS